MGQGQQGGLAAAARQRARGCGKEEFVLRDEGSRSYATLAFAVTGVGVGVWWGRGEGTQVPPVAQDGAASLLGDPGWALRTPDGLLLPRSPGT